MDFQELQERARAVRSRYAEVERSRYGRPWTAEEIMLGFMGDVGDLAKLVQGKAGVRSTPDLDDKVAHELADCLWCVLTLADSYEVNLQTAFLDAMDGISRHLNEDHRQIEPPEAKPTTQGAPRPK